MPIALKVHYVTPRPGVQTDCRIKAALNKGYLGHLTVILLLCDGVVAPTRSDWTVSVSAATEDQIVDKIHIFLAFRPLASRKHQIAMAPVIAA